MKQNKLFYNTRLLFASSSPNPKVKLLSQYFADNGFDSISLTKRKSFFVPKFLSDFFFERKVIKLASGRKLIGFDNIKNSDLLFVKSSAKTNNDFIKSAKKIAVVSKAQKQKFVSKGIKNENEIAYFYPFWSKPSDECMEKSEKKIIATYIENTKKSGIDEFLKIITNIDNKNFEVVIGCKENLAVQLQFYIANIRNVKVKIEIIVNQLALHNLFMKSDICIFAFQHPNFEDFVIDAMHCKNAVFVPVSNDSCEVLDFFATISANDDAQIGYKISALLGSDDELENIKTENYEIAQNFSIEKTAEKIKRVLF